MHDFGKKTRYGSGSTRGAFGHTHQGYNVNYAPSWENMEVAYNNYYMQVQTLSIDTTAFVKLLMLKTFKNAVFEIKVTWGLHILCELNVGVSMDQSRYGLGVYIKGVNNYTNFRIY